MNVLLIETFAFVLIILSTTGVSNSTNDSNLYRAVKIIQNPQSSCSQFTDEPFNSKSPIYVHRKFPILSKILTNTTLSVYFNQTLLVIEQFLLFFDHFFPEINRNQSTEIHAKIKSRLNGLIEFVNSTKSIGLCLDGKLYHSYLLDKHDYLCELDFNPLSNNSHSISDQLNSRKIINKNIQRIKWEPLICSSNPDGIKFPIRLVYSFQTHLTTKPSIIYFEFNVNEFKLDQCAQKLDRCQPETTTCIYHRFDKSQFFSMGNYYCQCRSAFFTSHSDMPNGFPGQKVENEYQNLQNNPVSTEYFQFQCEPCKTGCNTCTTGEPCKVTYEMKLLRGLPLAIQSFCITMCIVTGIIIFQLRRTRVIKNSNWILLELFLFGAVLIYCTIINAYFTPSEITCAIQPFLREGGFVLMYGVLYVKVYRVLCSFQSRKAQRVYVRDQDILRYLGVLVIICMGHLIAWLATGFDHRNEKRTDTFSDERKLSKDLNYLISKVCRSRFWEIVSYLYETGLLALTIYYCKCVKSAPSEYGEVRFITIAVLNELIISLLVILTRMNIIDKVHPDYIFLIHFIHCHATATISVLLLIGPKMWYLYRPPVSSANRPRLVPHTESHIIQTQQKLNGDVDLVEINLAEMDCETIRDELKRLYTQLEIYKTRAMRKDNPHVSRKRGGRKQRRFSLQHFHKKHHATSVHDDETSKISEDSPGNSGGEEATLTSTSNK